MCWDDGDVKRIDKGDKGNLLIRGFYEKGTDLKIDFKICDINQSSYQVRKSSTILKSTETAKTNTGTLVWNRKDICAILLYLAKE